MGGLVLTEREAVADDGPRRLLGDRRLDAVLLEQAQLVRHDDRRAVGERDDANADFRRLGRVRSVRRAAPAERSTGQQCARGRTLQEVSTSRSHASSLMGAPKWPPYPPAVHRRLASAVERPAASHSRAPRQSRGAPRRRPKNEMAPCLDTRQRRRGNPSAPSSARTRRKGLQRTCHARAHTRAALATGSYALIALDASTRLVPDSFA